LNEIDNYEELYQLVVVKKERPIIPNIKYKKISAYLINIMKECWNDDIEKRPTAADILESMETNQKYLE
jgi:hypothetical protein